MKISEKDFPLLKVVRFRTPIFDDDYLFPQIRNDFLMNKDFYSFKFFEIWNHSFRTNNIFYLTKKFHDSFTDFDVWWKLKDFKKDVLSSTGILLTPPKPSFCGRPASFILYKVENMVEDETVKIEMFLFEGLDCYGFSSTTWKYCDESVTTGLSRLTSSIANANPEVNSVPIEYVLSFLLFKQYADVEVKFSDGCKIKRTNINGDKYLNHLNVPLQIMDSRWFTTLVRSEGFNVKGHFRLQPYGKGLAKRKLVWISDYQKNGYTRKAQMLAGAEGSEIDHG